eukprot:TCALIF_05157-PA protein Name:"Similar to GAS1 Growth arrest-specific protein 1 (Homo sapiens)" AED:0.22 eAED:0.36 QI:0/0/0/1/0/0.25/4/0/251
MRMSRQHQPFSISSTLSFPAVKRWTALILVAVCLSFHPCQGARALEAKESSHMSHSEEDLTMAANKSPFDLEIPRQERRLYRPPELPAEEEPCHVSQLKCAYRDGCGLAIQNYMLACSALAEGKTTTCTTYCKHSLIALMSTPEGKRLMKYCAAMFKGKKCTKRCLNAIHILKKQTSASKLEHCVCDGSEDFQCRKIKDNMEQLCFNQPDKEEIHRDIHTNEIDNGASHLSTPTHVQALLMSAATWRLFAL